MPLVIKPLFIDTWRLTENNKRWVQVTEMDVLRKSSRISRKERIRNVNIRQQIKLAKFLQLIGTIKRIIFKKVRTETILKLYNTLILLTFLYGSKNWTLAALQRQRIEAAEMKLLRSLAGHALYDHKTNDSIRRELQTDCILGKIDEYRRNWLLHLQRMPQNRIPLKSFHYSPRGKRTIGRRKKRWREQL
jgi:hypothetical protein